MKNSHAYIVAVSIQKSMAKHVADGDLSARIVVRHLIRQQVQLQVIPDLQ